MQNSIKTRPLRAGNDENGLKFWQERYLLHGKLPDRGTPNFNPFEAMDWVYRGECARTWQEHRQQLLKRWTREHPGTRPFYWWEVDAPREPLAPWDPDVWEVPSAAIRRRVGGTGTPSFALPGNSEDTTWGLPTDFLTDFELEDFETWDVDRSKDLPARDTLKISEPLELYNPADPPRYESQASYLRRHGLLAAGEAEMLGPEAFAPEVVEAGEEQ